MFQPMTFQTGRSARGPAMSLTIHCAVIALLFMAGTNQNVQDALRATANAVPKLIAPYLPDKPGGGGSGDGSPLPASQGALPRVAPRQFTPPLAVVYNLEPRLVMEPIIVLNEDVIVPQVNLSVLGDPFARPGPPSNGTGKGGGIGDGEGTGVGRGKGPGVGPGEGGDIGTGGRLRGFTGGATGPVLLYKVEPEFSEEARKAKLQGVVELYAQVDTDGRLRNIHVTRGLGLGLEEKAIEAVRQWRFRPGYRDGKPVVEAATIEVNFHLL